MPDFDATDWRACKGERKLELTPRHMVDAWVSCTETVTLSVVPNDPEADEVLLRAGAEFRFRAPVHGCKTLVIRGRSATPYGLRLRHRPMQNGEPLSDEKPPVVALPEPGNLVAKMRQIAAQHHNQHRMPVLEPEDGPSLFRYEVDDDDEVLFEEEAHEKRQKEKKAAAEEAAKIALEGKKAPAPAPAPEDPKKSEGAGASTGAPPDGRPVEKANTPPPAATAAE